MITKIMMIMIRHEEEGTMKKEGRKRGEEGGVE